MGPTRQDHTLKTSLFSIEPIEDSEPDDSTAWRAQKTEEPCCPGASTADIEPERFPPAPESNPGETFFVLLPGA